MSEKKNQNNSEENLGILAHLFGLLIGFLGPLIMFFVVKDNKQKNHVKLSLNWQFSLLIYLFVGFLLIFLLIGFFIIPVLGILNLIFCIIAIVKASEGEYWKYPLSIPFFNVKT